MVVIGTLHRGTYKIISNDELNARKLKQCQVDGRAAKVLMGKDRGMVTPPLYTG